MSSADSTRTYSLAEPFTRPGSTTPVTAINFRKPKGRDLERVFAKGGNEFLLGANLAKILSDITPDEWGELAAADFIGAVKEASVFLELSPQQATPTTSAALTSPSDTSDIFP
jgi:hypothetical protein